MRNQFTKKPLVYVASPYTKGDPAMNTHFQCQVFDTLISDAIVTPFVPLWSHFQHIQFPRTYQEWTAYDLEVCDHCDAVIRLNAELTEHDYLITESSGADAEVAHFESQKKPVFYSIQECYDWASGRTKKDDTVFSQPNCIFNYCPQPDDCREKGCQQPRTV